MHFYRVTSDMSVFADYRETKDEAHTHAKSIVSLTTDRHSVRIELVDVITDKVSICRLLNQVRPVNEGPVLKTWRLTPRGGLAEIENGE